MRNITVTFADGSQHVYQNAPDDITPDQIMARASKEFGKKITNLDGGRPQNQLDTQSSMPMLAPKPIFGQAGFNQAMQETLGQAPSLTKLGAAFGSGARNIYEGARQLAGYPDQQAIQANQMIRKESPVTTFAGDVASFVPTALIPGAGGILGTANLAGAYAAFQPNQSNDQRSLNTALGAAGGLAGRYVGNKIGNAATNWMANKEATAAAERGNNAVVDETLRNAQGNGFKFPPTAYNKSDLLEGISGQYKTQQKASWDNQVIVNNLARKDLGIPKTAPITEDTFKAAMEKAKQPYKDVAALSQQADGVLKILNDTRFQAKTYWNHFNKSGDPSSLKLAIDNTNASDILEKELENYASTANKPELVDALREARTKLAQLHQWKDATRFSTGDINAEDIGKAYTAGTHGLGPQLTGNLAKIGQAAEARPQSLRMRDFAPNATTALDTGVSTISMAASPTPAKLLAGGIPLLRNPVRNYILSPGYQQGLVPHPSDYAVPITQKLEAWLLANPVAREGVYPGVGLGLLNRQNNQ